MPPTDVVFLSTAWGPRWGGENAFNRDLAVALAQLLGPRPALRVACVVPSGAAEVREIDGVEVLSLGRDDGTRELPTENAQAIVEVLARHKLAGSILIGHDLHTGPVALAVRDLLNAKADGASRVAVIVHTSPAAYKWLEGSDPEQIERKVERQCEVVRSAEMVFGVGPKLHRTARDLLRPRLQDLQPRRQPVMLIPGLAEIEPFTASPEQFQAITFGRLDPRAERVKQGRLALAGFAGVIAARYGDLGDDPLFTLVGADDGDVAHIRGLASRQAGRPIAVYARPFSEDRAKLWNLLSNQSVSLMLSVHEGFGLTGWEAIAAGVPLVVSQNTGLYELLKTHEGLGGKALGCVSAVDVRGSLDEGNFDERDLAAVGEHLARIARSPSETKRDALNLRKLCLDADLTWEATAKTFAQACGLKLPKPAGRPVSLLRARDGNFVDEELPPGGRNPELPDPEVDGDPTRGEALPGLTPDATYVLHSACERVLAEDSITGFLKGGEEFLLQATPPLDRVQCREAIDLLVELGYLRGAPVFGAGRKWIAFTVAPDGFVEFAKAFLADFEERRDRLLKHVINHNGAEFTFKIATAIAEQPAFVCLVLEGLIERDLLKGDRISNAHWCVYSPSARLKLEFRPAKRPADLVLEILTREADDTGEVALNGPHLRELWRHLPDHTDKSIPMRYFRYISSDKIDMIISQIPVAAKGAVSVSLGINLGILTASVSAERQALENRVARLLAAEKYIQDNMMIGSIVHPGSWFKGEVDAVVCKDFGEAILWCSGGSGQIVALGGSLKHCIGEQPSVLGYSDLHAIWPFLDFFSGRMEEVFGERGVITESNRTWGNTVRAAVDYLEKYASTPHQRVRFLAKTLWAESGVVVGTPLYVEILE